MSLVTSKSFASVIETGTDWRDISKKTLESLEKAVTRKDQFNFGFLYVTDHLADDLVSITNLFKSVLNIENWVGCVGIGICGSGQEIIDAPGISAMIGSFPAEKIALFPPVHLDDNEAGDSLQNWLAKHEPMLVLTHGDPAGQEDPAFLLKKLNEMAGGFSIGGLATSRMKCAQIAGEVYEQGMSGAAFSAEIPVATALSQGCRIAGPTRTITRGDEHTISELDNVPAVDIFESDMRAMVKERIGRDPNEIKISEGAFESPEAIPDEFKGLFKGEMYAAFPVSESDQRDYLVRNIIGLDEESGALDVAQMISQGERVHFVYRDDETVREDLTKVLLDMRRRIEREQGVFAPKGGIYVTCLARAFSDFGEGCDKKNGKSGEMQLIREIIGDIPLAGFYAGGEIKGDRLYGYTGILTLFL